MKMGRAYKIGGDQEAILLEIIKSNVCATLGEIKEELKRRTGVQAHERTIVSTLLRLGVERRTGTDAVKIEAVESASTRYGYQDRHREQSPEQLFSSCLSDREWELVEDIFAFEGGRGVPPVIPRRQLLDGCCYVVRTGCSWRMLPSCFGRWKNVYKTFRRWAQLGKFEQ